MTKLLVLALCVCLGMSMRGQERLEKSEALNESEENLQVACLSLWIGDGECDLKCNVTRYNFDGGDCGCPWIWIGDGDCDTQCNLGEYNLDGGDCGDNVENGEALKEAAEFRSRFCVPEMIGNGICNVDCYYREGGFDGGDCCKSEWMGDGTCDNLCNFEKNNWDGGDCPH